MTSDAEKCPTVARLKSKVKELLEDLEVMDSQEGRRTFLEYMTEMAEENKELNRKCRELAHTIKVLRQEGGKREEDRGRVGEAAAKRLDQAVQQCEREKVELRAELERVRAELRESMSSLELMRAQVQTYKEDFELERKDRERAMDRIEFLEAKLACRETPFPRTTKVYQSHSSRPQVHAMADDDDNDDSDDGDDDDDEDADMEYPVETDLYRPNRPQQQPPQNRALLPQYLRHFAQRLDRTGRQRRRCCNDDDRCCVTSDPGVCLLVPRGSGDLRSLSRSHGGSKSDTNDVDEGDGSSGGGGRSGKGNNNNNGCKKYINTSTNTNTTNSSNSSHNSKRKLKAEDSFDGTIGQKLPTLE